MKTAVSRILIIAAAICFSGCSILFQPALVANKHVDRWPVIDPNDYNIHVTKQADGSKEYGFTFEAGFDDEKQILPYWRGISSFPNPAVVRGELNGKAYDVIFDTGNNLGVFIEDVQINEHHLGVLFFNEENNAAGGGLAIVDSLKAGPLTFENYPCNFLSQHAEFRLLGILPVYRYRWIAMPIQLISKFSYIEYNQIDRELCISREAPFAVEDTSAWITVPFEIDERRILVRSSIEGIPMTLFLDTGSDSELELAGAAVEPLFEKRTDFAKARKRTGATYAPYAGGMAKVRKFTAKNLRWADHDVRNVEIFYRKKFSPQDQFPSEGTDGTIGLGLFRKTVMVLDFQNNLMWVKKAKWSRFEGKE